MLGQPGQCVLEYGQIGRLVLGQFVGTQEGDLRAIAAGNLRNFLVVGRHDGACHQLRLESRRNAEGNQWEAGERANVLAGNPFRTAACRDNGKDLYRRHHITRLSSRHPLPGWRRSCRKRRQRPGRAAHHSYPLYRPYAPARSWPNNSRRRFHHDR